MALQDDLNNLGNLCDEVSDAALDLLIQLGPRPSDPAGASAWDAQDALLKNKISTLNNLSSSISALIVNNALQGVWPNLVSLDAVSAAAQKNISEIMQISNAMAAVAAVITLGVAVVTLATQPTPGNAGTLATAFKNMVSAVSATSAPAAATG